MGHVTGLFKDQDIFASCCFFFLSSQAFPKATSCTFCPQYIPQFMAARTPHAACIIGCDRLAIIARTATVLMYWAKLKLAVVLFLQ